MLEVVTAGGRGWRGWVVGVGKALGFCKVAPAEGEERVGVRGVALGGGLVGGGVHDEEGGGAELVEGEAGVEAVGGC